MRGYDYTTGWAFLIIWSIAVGAYKYALSSEPLDDVIAASVAVLAIILIVPLILYPSGRQETLGGRIIKAFTTLFICTVTAYLGPATVWCLLEGTIPPNFILAGGSVIAAILITVTAVERRRAAMQAYL